MKYLYDGDNILMEFNGSDQLINRYTTSLRIDEIISRQDASGEQYYYHYDGLGSVTSLTDASQNVVATYRYDAFGEVYAQTGSVSNSYLFTGREIDTESGLYYYRARYYGFEIGRFVTQDPIGFEGGINFYLYVSNNPINYIDPSGLIQGRYKECEKYGRIRRWLCRKTVDRTCSNSIGAAIYCCKVDLDYCISEIDFEHDPCAVKKAKKCYVEYSNCMAKLR